MTSSVNELRLSMARAEEIIVTEDALTAELEDGRTISVPIVWYPRLSYSTQEERNNWCLIGKGSGIHWPDLDEHISIENLLVGSPSAESQRSFKRWLEWHEGEQKVKTDGDYSPDEGDTMKQSSARIAYEDMDIEERLMLIEEIWDSIASEQEMPELTEEQKAELDRRIESYRRSPGGAVTWEAVVARLTSEK